jgi:valyl-tRNA synthetase
LKEKHQKIYKETQMIAKEEKMEMSLKKLDDVWSKLEFDFAQHKDTDVFVAKLAEAFKPGAPPPIDVQLAAMRALEKSMSDQIQAPLPAEQPREERLIPIIGDEHVDFAFGTGVLKVTPAHDKADFEIGARHKLPNVDVMNPDGTMNALAGKDLAGLERSLAVTVGVIETGLFIGMAETVLIGTANGVVTLHR